MTQVKAVSTPQSSQTKDLPVGGLLAVFITQFVSFLFIEARNIAQPVILTDLNGLALFPWLIALPALCGGVGTLLFGKLSDMYGRRAILLTSMGIFAGGLLLCCFSSTMTFFIIAQTLMSLGHFPIIPLCFSVIGDLFSPTERAKWTGLLNLPTTLAALVGPTLGGFIAESTLGWRAIFWGTIPLVVLAAALITYGVSGRAQKMTQKVDILGTIMMVIASSTLIFGVSWLGDPSRRGFSVILISFSIAAWVAFILVEQKAEAPILDPQVLFNRTFLTAAGAGFMSLFGLLGIRAYSPIFVQNVMGVSPAISGSMLTPYSVIVAFMGIAAGFLVARTKKYKWMYKIGYAIVTMTMFAMWRFTAVTPIWLFVLVTSVAGFGLGAIPTVNTLVAQFAVPKRLLGMAVGAMFFSMMIGIAIAPSLLGLVQNSSPDLEVGLKRVFFVGAVATAISLLLIMTIPEVSMDIEVPDKAAK